jgi:hypothetical protein
MLEHRIHPPEYDNDGYYTATPVGEIEVWADGAGGTAQAEYPSGRHAFCWYCDIPEMVAEVVRELLRCRCAASQRWAGAMETYRLLYNTK